MCGDVRAAVICRAKYERGWNCTDCLRSMQRSFFQFLVEYSFAYAGKELLESGRWNNPKGHMGLGIAHAPTMKNGKT